MILGRQFFVIPSDALAVVVENADECIPYFSKEGGEKSKLKSAARSMPTSRALDRVGKERGIRVFETPTGWKFFGNLMESGCHPDFVGKEVYKPFICGEEVMGLGVWVGVEVLCCRISICVVKDLSVSVLSHLSFTHPVPPSSPSIFRAPTGRPAAASPLTLRTTQNHQTKS
jgi:hypothetical protein